MAKACGLRIGPRGYEFVLLEGSAKKHKVTASEAGDLPFGSDPEGAVKVLQDLSKRHEIPRDSLRVVMEGGQAAFRTVNLPINDDDKIEKVVKFEVESELPQFNIEDVVVDWTRLSSTKDSCSLLTTVVKKEDLQGLLDVCERGGVEPLEVDVDTSAIVNAADAAGALDSESACLVVFVGEESSSIAVLDGGELRELRSIKQGALTHMPAPTRDEDEESADEVLSDDVPEEEPEVIDEVEHIEEELDELEVLDEVENVEEEPQEEAPSTTDHDEVYLQVLARMQRELARTITGARTLKPIERVLVSGYGMPGLIGTDILEVPVEALEGLPDKSLSWTRMASAYGAAVSQLGGGILKASLRREELRFTGTLERLELPLAVAGLLLVTFLGVWNIRMHKERGQVSDALGLWRDSAVAFMKGDPAVGTRGNLEYPSETITKYTENTTGSRKEMRGEEIVWIKRDDEVRNRYEQMTYLRGKLQMEITELKRQLGQSGDITQPQSALKGVTYVLEVLDKTKEIGARPSIRAIRGSFQKGGSSGGPDRVDVVLDMTLFAEDQETATLHLEAFRADLEKKPWLIEYKPAKIEPLDNGINLKRIRVTLDVSKIEEAVS